jgi:hypothetical protein
MTDLMECASKVSKWIRGFHIIRFISLQPALAITQFMSPMIEEEFILNFKLLKAGWAHRLLHPINIWKIISNIRSESAEASRFLYKKSSIPQKKADVSLSKLPKVSFARRIYSIYPKVAAVTYKHAGISLLKVSTLESASKISSVTLQKPYKTKALEATPSLKSFDEKNLQRYLKVVRAFSRTYEEGMELSIEKLLEVARRELRPALRGIGESSKQFAQRSYLTFIRAYTIAQKRKDTLPTYEAYIERIIYSQAFLFKPTLQESLDLITKKTWWSEFYTLPQIFIENLLGRLSPLSQDGLSKTVEIGKPLILPVHMRVFFGSFMHHLTRQLLSSELEHFRLLAEFSGKLVIPSSTFSLMEDLIKSLVDEGFRRDFIGFKVARRYAEAISWALPHLMDYYSIVTRIAPKTKPTITQLMRLTEYHGLMEKSLNVVHSSIFGVKAIFGNILLKFDSGRLVKSVSEGLITHIYSTISKPWLEGSYSGWDESFQLLRAREITLIPQTFSSAPPSQAVRVQRPINITVRVESPADEGDLRELERKMIKILREEARRHGLNI